MEIRPLHTIDEFREVIALEKEIWGYADPDDGVGIPIFVVTVKRGGILLGAHDAGRLVGFVYSIPGLKHGHPMQWSHMLGVRAEFRGTGIGRDLKLAQRRIALDMGLDLMEWTVDPLVAVNAHLNFRTLGVVVEEYAENVYGASTSALHRGAPTDRFIAQWWMRAQHVESVVAGAGGTAPFFDLPLVNAVADRGEWLACSGFDLDRADADVAVSIPAGFTDMLERAPDLGRAWRLASCDIFTHYFRRGYRVIDFAFGPGPREGRYRLTNRPGEPA